MATPSRSWDGEPRRYRALKPLYSTPSSRLLDLELTSIKAASLELEIPYIRGENRCLEAEQSPNPEP